MSQIPFDEDVARLTDAVRDHEGSTITGAALGMLLRRAVPTLDVRAVMNMPFGTGALARFVDSHLQHVLRNLGHTQASGGDNIYAILRDGDSDETATRSSVPLGPAYWNAFVRSSDDRQLVVVRVKEGVALRFADEADAGAGQPIRKVAPDEFQQITEQYQRTLESSPQTALLANSVREAKSYAEFVQVLKNAGGAYFLQWSLHRRERLRNLFVQRVAAAGYSDAEQQQLLSLLDASQEASRHQSKVQHPASATSERQALPLTRASNGERQARELLKAIVDRMSTQEMRALSVSLGHVLDALYARNAK